MHHPCLTCGACCAFFRVSFHWSEADPELGGQVPPELTESLRTHERVMRGTSQANPRCVALDADIGRYSRCTIHDRRPSVCALVPASYEFGEASAQCDKARGAQGWAALTPGDGAAPVPARPEWVRQCGVRGGGGADATPGQNAGRG